METFSTRRACFFKSTTFCRRSFFMSRIKQKTGYRKLDQRRVYLCAGGLRKRALELITGALTGAVTRPTRPSGTERCAQIVLISLQHHFRIVPLVDQREQNLERMSSFALCLCDCPKQIV